MLRWRHRHTLALLALLTGTFAARVRAQDSAATPATSALRLARIFTDGMVVQRGARIPVWGWAPPGTAITARFRGATARATAAKDGRWSLSFPAASAGGPYSLTLVGGAQHLSIGNVLVGDVWVASGQSNMEFTVSGVNDAAAEIAAAHDSLIREFKVPISWAEHPAEDVAGGSWAPADPQHVGAMSAVAYFMARDLRAAEHVPIGIVDATWGGSAIETWLSADAQKLGPDGAARALATERTRLDSVARAMSARYGKLEHDSGLVNGDARWASPTLGAAGWTTIKAPALWETQGYADLDGIAWYRTTVTLTADEAARGARLSLGMVDDDDITWVNGVEVGRTSGYNVQRHYDVPASALHAGANVIAVRVFDGQGGGGIYGDADSLHLDAGGVSHSLAGDWQFRIGQIASGTMDGQRLNKVPAITFNKMVHPLLPIAIKGVIWYQGESNANSVEQARAYRDQLRTLVTSWRREWNGGKEPSFPFLWVQLPNYMAPQADPNVLESWTVMRESMTAATALPKTGQAVTIDVGGADELHPRNKQAVGHRLALVARKVAYGENVVASGPTYRSHTVLNGRVVVHFGNIGKGLVAHGDSADVGGFAVAGADKRWHWARAKIEGNDVLVWSDNVAQPVAVRYAWQNDPEKANLYNRDGLPAAPFRTDTW